MSAAPLDDGVAIHDRLHAIVDLLAEAAPRLAQNPFFDPAPAWMQTEPALARTLLALTDAELDACELDAETLAYHLGGLDPLLGRARALTWLAPAPDTPGDRELARVPGRKATQIRAFAAALPHWSGPFVDWCAGKGHLGRVLADRSGAAVRCLERDPALCAAGVELARGSAVRFETRDLLCAPPALAPAEQLVALHACGHLHDALIDAAALGPSPVDALAFAPCCYHLGSARGAPWQPRSGTGPDLPLADDLARLAVRETVTAPTHVRRRRLTERAFRLGFEALRRDLEPDAPGPRSLPSMPGRLFGADFEAFCRHAAAHLGLELPAGSDRSRWLRAGQEADARARRLELARTPLRRLLELRMVLDRALLLHEQGYGVRVIEFVARRSTPRNLLVIAERGLS